MVGLHNFMEDLVEERTNDYLSTANSCSCDKCRFDIMAHALNNLPALYFITQTGELYTKINELKLQFKVDVDVAVIKAARLIAFNPKHGE